MSVMSHMSPTSLMTYQYHVQVGNLINRNPSFLLGDLEVPCHAQPRTTFLDSSNSTSTFASDVWVWCRKEDKRCVEISLASTQPSWGCTEKQWLGASKCLQILLSASLCLWVPLSTSEYLFVPLSTSLCLWVPLSTSEYLFVPLSSSKYLWVPLCASEYL